MSASDVIARLRELREARAALDALAQTGENNA